MTQPINPSTIAARVRPLVVKARSAPRRAARSAALGTVRVGDVRKVYICYYGQAPQLLEVSRSGEATPSGDTQQAGSGTTHLRGGSELEVLQAAIALLHKENDLIQVAVAEYRLVPQLVEFAQHHAPHVDVMDGPTSYLTPYFDAVLSARLQATEREKEKAAAQKEQERLAAEKKHWFIGADASLQKGRPGAGIACVREDGRHRYEYRPDVASVFAAEVLAIELAIRKFEGRLTIYSDSRKAVALVKDVLDGAVPTHHNSAVNVALASISRRAIGRKIAIHWVRGHNGFALNETADRLARFARRAHHSHVRHQPGLIAQIVPDQVATEIVENIISDYRAVN